MKNEVDVVMTVWFSIIDFFTDVWHQLQIEFGSRCECGGMYEDVFEEIGWNRGVCNGCGDVQNW